MVNSKKTSKAELYNDLHPKTSLKNTGFKDKETALKTISLVSKRSLRYQFDVINTMFNRAKHHPNKTDNMNDAIKVFSKWLKNYKSIKKKEDKKYPWLPLETIKKYEKIAEEYGISEVARGIKKSTKTDEGFLRIYKKVGGKSHKLQYIPIKKDKPSGQDYWSYRISFIKSRLGQMKANKTELFYTEDKYKGLPTKQHIILIMHGYSPAKNL